MLTPSSSYFSGLKPPLHCSWNIQLYYPGILPWTTFDVYFTKQTVQAELAILETSSGSEGLVGSI